jgi:argininosuccinate lyase
VIEHEEWKRNFMSSHIPQSSFEDLKKQLDGVRAHSQDLEQRKVRLESEKSALVNNLASLEEEVRRKQVEVTDL